jgi:uncharacterized protein (TIGR02172 family)
MDIKTTKHREEVTIALCGRLDTSVSRQVAADIDSQLAECGTVTSLTCDMAEVDYISSSGLRILLGLAQRYKNFRIAEAQPEVYQVFEMTGFTKIMQIERALRQLSVDGCTEIGHGGVGTVYRIDDDTIIKVFREGTTLNEVRREITMAKEAFVLGMPTAISFDVVRVGSCYGLVFELLRAETLSACIRREPERIDEYACLFARLFRQMHAIEVPPGGNIPSALEREEWAVRHISRYFDTESIDILLHIVSLIPHGNRLLHGDLQTKNAMMDANGQLMLIDMGEVSYGHPIIDLAHAYGALIRFIGVDYEDTLGITREMGSDIFHRMLSHYFGGLDAADLAHRIGQIEAVSCVRNLSWLSLSDSFPEACIRMCQDFFRENIASRKDYLFGICETLNDWTI